ncbi:Hypothetical predicted protein [Xyrichtys novacula]|uniref:Uncharacterized protein n=1 Tax=Xyrichtys novacula TaxID=13765 RepID=A0AAV1FWY1_XYRNO|nr:Hypothetical predicted protein [Xyrichtys novacula]
MGQLARPQNPSALVIAPVLPLSSFFFFLSSPLLTITTLPFLCQPCVACYCPSLPSSLEHTSHPQRRRRPSQLAALTLIDLAPVLTQTPGETFSERQARMGEKVLPARRREEVEGFVWIGTGTLRMCVWAGETPQIITSSFCCVYNPGSTSSYAVCLVCVCVCFLLLCLSSCPFPTLALSLF